MEIIVLEESSSKFSYFTHYIRMDKPFWTYSISLLEELFAER